MIKVLILSLAVAMVSCQYHQQPAYQSYQPKGGYESHDDYNHEEYAEPHYSFEYSVSDPHTGDYHSQREQRQGDNTQGEYSLVEPDGSKRNVQYHVQGKSGFIAEVHREAGKGGYEQAAYRPQPSYNQHQPSYQQPQQSYRPQPSYHQSQPSYQQPQQSYRPQPSYKPQQSYSNHY